MQLSMTPEAARESFILQSFAEHTAEDFQPTTDKAGVEKLVEGKPTYRIPVVVVNRQTGRPETAVYVKVLEQPTAMGLGEFLLTGEIRVTPFVSNGRQAFSIVADSIQPATANAKTPFGKE